jgi:kumamolisin
MNIAGRMWTWILVFLTWSAAASAQAALSSSEDLGILQTSSPQTIDRGPLVADSGSTPISVTVALHLPALEEAETLMTALHTPGDPQFHKFLTADEFTARFAPKDAEVASVISALGKYGLSAERVTATTLKVTGLPANMERAFAVSLHSYEEPAHGNAPAYRFHAPLTAPTIPAEIAPSVVAVVGLDTRHALRPHLKSGLKGLASPAAASTSQGNAPGLWTVTDFANYYDVVPLYNKGLSGKGRTMGIVTLANFTPSDVFAYWNSLGLDVNSNRLQVINIDGGPGAPSDASDSMETTLDVEQSGGVAPGAKIIVYQAPNTNQAWVDAFAAAVDANVAESISTSWGQWEWYSNLANGPVTDPATGRIVGMAQAFHELFVRAAIQGQTLFASAGDQGAYDPSQLDEPPFAECFPSTTPSCSITLGVDNPAGDTAITAAGGTTVAGPQGFCLNAACTPPLFYVNVPHERVWGWDYLESLCVALGTPDPIACGTFPWGSGGGVSVFFPEPSYQYGLPGVQTSQPGQNFVMNGQLLFALPSDYAGRNLPDISFNADPDTGYVIWYTSDVTGFSVQTYWGGTSFVAPQLNGVTALIGQELNSRIGLLNYPLYQIAQRGEAYRSPNAPFNAIRYGDNWFYFGSNGYNLGVGLGTMDVANFAEFLGTLQ